LVLAGQALALAACTPPPLTDAPDTSGDTNDVPRDAAPPDSNPADMDSGAEATGGDDTDTMEAPPFSEVATIVRGSCAKSNCHGDPPGADQEFSLGSNDPSEAAIQETLEGTNIKDPPAPMVEAGTPDESGLYQALIPLENRTQMPLGEELADDKIETIRTWIAGGAPYE
jgi:hypothetical protein